MCQNDSLCAGQRSAREVTKGQRPIGQNQFRGMLRHLFTVDTHHFEISSQAIKRGVGYRCNIFQTISPWSFDSVLVASLNTKKNLADFTKKMLTRFTQESIVYRAPKLGILCQARIFQLTYLQKPNFILKDGSHFAPQQNKKRRWWLPQG